MSKGCSRTLVNKIL